MTATPRGRTQAHTRTLDGTKTYGTFLSSHSSGRCRRISNGSASADMTINSEIPRLSVLVAAGHWALITCREEGKTGIQCTCRSIGITATAVVVTSTWGVSRVRDPQPSVVSDDRFDAHPASKANVESWATGPHRRHRRMDPQSHTCGGLSSKR